MKLMCPINSKTKIEKKTFCCFKKKGQGKIFVAIFTDGFLMIFSFFPKLTRQFLYKFFSPL